MRPARLGIALVTASFALTLSTDARAATLGTNLGGAITVTGTDGKDVLEVEFTTDEGGRDVIVVTPAATVTAASGTCPPNTDPLTGRPTFNQCGVQATSSSALVVNLRGGDDALTASDAEFAMTAVDVNGGLGNDSITAAMLAVRRLRGEGGDDMLVAEGGLVRVASTSSQSPPVAFDGGSGTDLAGWDETGVGGIGSIPDQELGVTASLVTGIASMSGIGSGLQQITYRTDTLAGIESLAGTAAGDAFTGSASANTLIGNDGNDNLNGGDGPDNLQGGDDLDDLVSGKGSDLVDGGLGIDTFPADSGGDTINSRDGFLEQVTCVQGDTIINDLVDRVGGSTTGCSISTAAAKHRYDTKLSGRPARIADGELRTKVRCPGQKPERCEGEVEALLGKRTLARGDYEVKPGKRLSLALPISNANGRRADGKRIVLAASEIDADGRDRFVSRPVRVR
jgi:hypothetical protein